MFKIVEMTEEYARDICSWQYGDGYEMYSFDNDEADFEQAMSGLYLPVVFTSSGELAGFIAVGPAAQVMSRASSAIYRDESYTDMALGLRPSLCGRGKGYGEALLNCCVQFLKDEFTDDGIRLTVASENARAKKIYLRNGFKTVFEFKKYMEIKSAAVGGGAKSKNKRKLVSFEIMQKD